MPEITKSGAKLHLFIVTHKYTDLYFIFSFNNQPQVGKPTWGYNYTTVLRRLPRPIVRHHHRIAHPHRPPSSYCPLVAIHRHRRKTAEERFHTLARGWLAYPVTPTHHPSTAEERLYKRHPSVCLVAERRHSSVTRYAKRSVACRDSPRHQPLRAGGTPLSHLRRLPHPSSATHRIAHPHRPPSIYMRFGDALLRRPRKRSRLQLTPDRVGGTRTDAYAPRSAAAERSIAKCRKLGRR